MELPAAFITGLNGVTDEVNSARPDAPVVPYVEPTPRGRSVRLVLSAALHRAARAVAPVERGAAC
jgi:hypothetical protein